MNSWKIFQKFTDILNYKMTKHKQITIAIPVFNDQEYIARCIDSALEQSSELVKIIISDNNSSDNTSEICQSYASKHDHVTYIRHNTNIGGFENFRYLAEQCDTEYFMWLASDDWISKDFIEASYGFLSSNNDYVLATATSAYYDPDNNNFLFATSTSSIESNDSNCRAIEYIKNLTDNSEFYGLYRTSSIKLERHKVIGSDWLWGINTAFEGKIKSMPKALIHRNYKWNNPNRSAEVAKSEGLPIPQGEQPHYATALFSFFYFSNLPKKDGNGSTCISLAWEIFKEFKNSKSIPSELFIFNDCSKFFGADTTKIYLKSLRHALHKECNKILNNQPAELTLNKVLEITLTLKTWQQNEANLENRRVSNNDFYDFVVNSIDNPAYLCSIVPKISEISEELRFLVIDYLTHSIQFFQKDELIELYSDHLMGVLKYFNTYYFNALEIHPLRMPAHKQRSLEYLINKINMISVYFSAKNVKSIMIERGNLLRNYLMVTGVAVDHQFSPKSSNTKKKIGLIAQSLNSPTDTYTSLPALSNLDKTKFEIVIFTLSLASADNISPMENYAANIADKVILLNGGTNSEIIDCIRKEDLDAILIGNNITAVSNKLSLISCARLARNQISFNPSCVTSGYANIDYYISGTFVEPSDAQDQYTEKLVLIDGPAHTRLLPVNENFEFLTRNKREDEVTRFVSGANFYKLTPNTIQVWLKTLKEIPKSTLSLYPFGPAWSSNYDVEKFLENLKKEAAINEISFDRIEILSPFININDIRVYLQKMDVYLDSFPFSGINSLLDPLSVGLPIVSLKGNSFRSNMGASVLRELDLLCLLAENEVEYVEICKKLSKDPMFLEEVSSTISRKLKSSRLYDTNWFSKEFEQVFSEILK
jgi:predicted O-linked N-acetylglucosamine transferase (SPINDLY family)